MKYKKLIILILVVLTMLNINSCCFAKYVFECTKTAVIIETKN